MLSSAASFTSHSVETTATASTSSSPETLACALGYPPTTLEVLETEVELPAELLLEALTLLVIRVSKLPKETLEEALELLPEDVEKADPKEVLLLAKAEELVVPVERKLVVAADSVTQAEKTNSLSGRLLCKNLRK